MNNLKEYIIEKLKINKKIFVDPSIKLVEDLMDIFAVRFENKWHPEIAENRNAEFMEGLKKALDKININKLEDLEFITDYNGDITKLKKRYKEFNIKEHEDLKITVDDDCFQYITTNMQEVICDVSGFYLSTIGNKKIILTYRPNPSYASHYRFIIKPNR